MNEFELNIGDVSEICQEFDSNYFEGCFCDPPYGLNFMGKEWDYGVPSKEIWKEVIRVLKPGGMLLAFGGTRTFHRLACAIEDAGFEIRDCLMWVYGSGFPKSHNIGKAVDKFQGNEREIIGKRNDAFLGGTSHKSNWRVGEDKIIREVSLDKGTSEWEGWGTALKPAWEPIILAMKPIEGTFVNNALKYGCGGLNIDGCRIGTEEIITQGGDKFKGKGIYGKYNTCEESQHQGRFPANLIHNGSEEVLELFPDTKSGWTDKDKHKGGKGVVNNFGANGITGTHYADNEGSAARFFYCAKASKKERNAGCETNNHPTVKPLSLTEYLAKLILPPKSGNFERKLLVPFSGSGSEMVGGLKAGWDFVCGIELEEKYVEIAEARLSHHQKELKC